MPSMFQSLLAAAVLAISVNARAMPGLLARGATDTCGNLDAALKAPDLGVIVTFGFIDACLCISGIPSFIATNPIAHTASLIVGTGTITTALTNMINTAPDHKTCTYPDNSEAVCSPADACAFQCKNGFTPSPSKKPTSCVCLAPNKVCNGVCGKFGNICPSSPPKKREVEVLQRRAQSSCDVGFTACGVYGWQGFNSAEAWECIDTKTDLESCGGCTIAFGGNPARGVDCTAIPGVMDVSCASGTCVVHRCTPGYTVSMDGSYCIRKSLVEEAGEDLSAALYGLEHVPLKRTA